MRSRGQKKFLAVILAGMLVVLLVRCARAPTEPQSETATLSLTDEMSGVRLANVELRLNGRRATTDSLGRVDVELDPSSTLVEVFPYKPVALALRRGEQREVRLVLPASLRRYERMLLTAKRQGYIMLGVYNWWTRREELTGSRFIILRHDVDYDPETAKAMAFVEKLVGAHSTFYFRWVTETREAVDFVKCAGHEVGLHYETLALYCEAHDITRPEQVTDGVLARCRTLLKQEIARFEEAAGDIHSIASHGAARNRLLGIPNAVLTWRQNLEAFGVEVDASLLEWHLNQEGIDIFTADSGGRWAPMPLNQALHKGFERIYTLVHPCWWRPRMWGRFAVYRP